MKESLSLYQLFVMMVLVPYSTAVLFFLGSKANQDAWIAMLIYILGGIALQLIYISLHNKFPRDTIITYMPKIFGKIPGNIISVIYILQFTYLSSRIVRDYAELSKIFGLKETPIIMTSMVLVLTVMYNVYCGIEVIARIAEMVFFILIFIPAAIWILLSFTTGVINISNVQPILSEGIIFVIKNEWMLITYPYGETILFTMIYPYIKENKGIKKVCISAIIFQGIILSMNVFSYIVTIGVENSQNLIAPMFQAAALVKLGGAITRIEILVIAVLVIGGVYKSSMFMYGAVLGTTQIFKLKNRRVLIIPFGIIILFLSQVIAKNFAEHIEIGLERMPYANFPIEVIIPTIALIVSNIRNQ